MKYFLISYFSKHICPDRFSLTSEKAKSNDFYEVRIYIPDATNEEIKRIPKKNRGSINVKFEFIPIKNASRWGGILAGRKKSKEDTEFSDCLLSCDYLRHSRIDVSYYFGHWIFSDKNCSTRTLIKLFLLRFIHAAYLSILKQKILSIIRRKIIFRKLQSPLRSKFEIYEALMNDDKFLRTGTFKKSDLSKSLFGEHYIVDYKIYKKISQSLDWIIESCVEDNEVQRISHANDNDPLYKIKGKGVHYFTITKESIRNNAANHAIQEQQLKIQRKMSWLTLLLVIGTFLSVLDKKEHIIKIMKPVAEQGTLYLHLLVRMFI